MSDQIENVARAYSKIQDIDLPWTAYVSEARFLIKAANQCLPIETAPKDGTRILGYTPAGVFTIYWMDEQVVSDCGRGVVYAGWWSDGGETRPGSNMANPLIHDGEDLAQCEPTGWMPLPAVSGAGGGA